MRTLLIRPGAIGDTIVTLPAMQALAEGAGEVEVWAPENNLPLFRFAGSRRSIRSTGLDLLGLPDTQAPERLIERLRQFQQIYSWYGAGRPEFREAVRNLKLPFRFFPALPPHPAPQHAVDFFLEQAGLSHLAGACPTLGCAARRQPFLVIHPFSGSPRKNWALDRFRALAEQLPLPVQWCAGPEEPLEGAVRFDDLYRLAEWLATATLYVGNDSGISHLAAAAGTPVVAIFTLMDARVWAPRGSLVRIVEGPDSSAVSLEQVAATCHEVLDSIW